MTSFLAILGCAMFSYAQVIDIKGVIVDDEGAPVIGAAVLVAGTELATIFLANYITECEPPFPQTLQRFVRRSNIC